MTVLAAVLLLAGQLAVPAAPRPAAVIPASPMGFREQDQRRTGAPGVRTAADSSAAPVGTGTPSPSAVPPVEATPSPRTWKRPLATTAPRRTATPPPRTTPRRPGPALAGLATWYAAPAGTAAAGPALRAFLGRSWRGARVSVCPAAGDCVAIVLSDWCACGERHGLPTLLDLSAASFASIAALSRGVASVTVRRSNP